MSDVHVRRQVVETRTAMRQTANLACQGMRVKEGNVAT